MSETGGRHHDPRTGRHRAPMLAARGVDFSYGGSASHFRVADWSAEFWPGTVTAVTGPSGCGKSTRLYLLGLMLGLDAGRLELDGARVDDLPDAARAALRAHRFGFVFQDAALDATRTVLDNICETALYRSQRRAPAAARATELMRRFDIDVPADRRPGQISGGQAQRIALCRALLGDPPVVLADEPTGNLDPVSSGIVLEAFRSHADRGGCVVVVTHDPTVADWADRRIDLGVAA